MGALCCGGSSAPRSNTKSTPATNKEAAEPTKQGGLNKAQFIWDNNGKILDIYTLDKKKIGEGSYGSVCKATRKESGKDGRPKVVHACKTIAKQSMKNMDRFKQEIDIMKMMDHPNIIKLYETFADHRSIYLIMELCSGGELFDRIIQSGHFTEVQAAILMQQIIRAINYMHANLVCHRDLKPENFLFMTKDTTIEKNTLKLIDFGLSCKFQKGQVLTTRAGTPYYVAPQVLNGKYDEKSDLWSCGVIMYVLLCGYPPFFGETDAEVLTKVRLGNFAFNASDWKNITENAKNLIRQLLQMSPKSRITAQNALKHVWILEKAPKAPQVKLEKSFVQNLRAFKAQNQFKKAALLAIAHSFNKEEHIKKMRDTFHQLDENGDGILSQKELKEGIAKAFDHLNLPVPDDLNDILECLDSDGSGVIDYTEFLAAALDKSKTNTEDNLWAAFRMFDRNGDGKITQEELREVLNSDSVGEGFGIDQINEIMQSVDTDNSGNIDFEEFKQMMMKDTTAGQ
mmetsp:Transcript_113567/g.355171  ORF Transcript_113567/g.355171 Transcript_113567/m.355171 type:complete len:512 (-) Transcript_113567:430-1965(-)